MYLSPTYFEEITHFVTAMHPLSESGLLIDCTHTYTDGDLRRSLELVGGLVFALSFLMTSKIKFWTLSDCVKLIITNKGTCQRCSKVLNIFFFRKKNRKLFHLCPLTCLSPRFYDCIFSEPSFSLFYQPLDYHVNLWTINSTEILWIWNTYCAPM